MKFRRRRPRENIDINLVSLIDVVFILLLFFIVTTTFTRETQLRVTCRRPSLARPRWTRLRSIWTSPSMQTAFFP